jgi:hypothetical protein
MKLKNEATQNNISMAQLIRKKMQVKIENAPAPKKTKKSYQVVDPKLLFEINKIGNNINQIAKILNTKKDKIPNSLILKELAKIESDLKSLL